MQLIIEALVEDKDLSRAVGVQVRQGLAIVRCAIAEGHHLLAWLLLRLKHYCLQLLLKGNV